jgi:tetratricopeptide (TPR) repeat protein
MKNFILNVFFMLFVFFIGCKPTQYNIGWEHIYDKNYNQAIPIFNEQLAKDKTDYSAIYGLGVAHYFNGEIDKSINYLEEANSLKPANTEIKYYLGLCYEEKNDYRSAIKYYQYFNDKSLDGNYSKLMESRLHNAIKLQYQTEVKDIIQNEQKIGENLSDSTIAILTFENRAGERNYAPLEIGFPSMFITDFALVPKLKVVERLRIQSILDELELNKRNIIDESTMQRVGKLLQAKNIVKGGFIIQSNDNLIIDLAVINVLTGKIEHQLNKSGNLNDFYRIEKDLVLEVVGKMGIVLTEEVRQKILTIPTENFFEFLARIRTMIEEEQDTPPDPDVVLQQAFDINMHIEMLNAIDVEINNQANDHEIRNPGLPNVPREPERPTN